MRDSAPSSAIWMPGTLTRDNHVHDYQGQPGGIYLDEVHTPGDAALADVSGLLERLDVPQLRALWPGGHISVKQ